MNKKDFSNLEDQIMSTVSSALKAIDIANLKSKLIAEIKRYVVVVYKPYCIP